jgi:hypothetical protein
VGKDTRCCCHDRTTSCEAASSRLVHSAIAKDGRTVPMFVAPIGRERSVDPASNTGPVITSTSRDVYSAIAKDGRTVPMFVAPIGRVRSVDPASNTGPVITSSSRDAQSAIAKDDRTVPMFVAPIGRLKSVDPVGLKANFLASSSRDAHSAIARDDRTVPMFVAPIGLMKSKIPVTPQAWTLHKITSTVSKVSSSFSREGIRRGVPLAATDAFSDKTVLKGLNVQKRSGAEARAAARAKKTTANMAYDMLWLTEDRQLLWDEDGFTTKDGMRGNVTYTTLATGAHVGRRSSSLFAPAGDFVGGKEAAAAAKAAKLPAPEREGDHMLRLMDTKAVVRMVTDQGQHEYVSCDCDDLRTTMGFDNKIIVTRDDIRGRISVSSYSFGFLTSKVTSGGGTFCAKDEVMLDRSTPASTLLVEDLTLCILNSRQPNAKRVAPDDEGLFRAYQSEWIYDASPKSEERAISIDVRGDRDKAR